MNSPFALLYLAIMQRLDAITIIKQQGGSPEKAIRFINQELGQLELHNGDSRPPVSWPCVLIDFDNTNFKDLSTNAQTGELTIKLRIGFNPYSATTNLTPAESRNKALFFYELEQAIHAAIHCWAPGDVIVVDDPQQITNIGHIFGKLHRIATQTEERSDLIRVRTLTYKCGMDDNSTKKPFSWLTVPIDITAEFDTEL